MTKEKSKKCILFYVFVYCTLLCFIFYCKAATISVRKCYQLEGEMECNRLEIHSLLSQSLTSDSRNLSFFVYCGNATADHTSFSQP